ncbi:hypothetical protein [Clostridium sp.]|uniref:hypothetical protein n=1 Tax=Clostridium sp. TaxID=1506 RepID=UPI0025BC0BCF|nr:hypothetical protein [Clostridium sp.]
MAVKVRNKRLKDIMYLENYNYENYNVINEKGFKIKVKNKEELELYFEEYNSLISLNHKVKDFYNK